MLLYLRGGWGDRDSLLDRRIGFGKARGAGDASRAELRDACDYLGFDLVPASAEGFDKVNVARRAQDPTGWHVMVTTIAGLLAEHRPSVVFFPHDQDWNSTHVGVHHLAMAATSFHVGEVRRNPYHLLLPAWMQDNVRRGGELVGGQGGAAPDFVFAALYRLRRFRQGNLEHFYTGGRNLPAGRNARAVLD